MGFWTKSANFVLDHSDVVAVLSLGQVQPTAAKAETVSWRLLCPQGPSWSEPGRREQKACSK